MRYAWYGVLLAGALAVSACGSTFVVSKNGKGYYLGNGSSAAYAMFCESGDLLKILAGTTLAEDMKDTLYRYNCGAERSSTKVREAYASLAPVQRKELRMSFKKNGYDINHIPC
jgi:hypothetical protein